MEVLMRGLSKFSNSMDEGSADYFTGTISRSLFLVPDIYLIHHPCLYHHINQSDVLVGDSINYRRDLFLSIFIRDAYSYNDDLYIDL